jgi:Zn finger protein HypA/HybF involved in hydrogenase expression
MKQKHIDKFTDQELIDQYKIMPSLSKLSHYFNVPDVTLWRRAKRLGLEFKIGANKKIELDEILQGMHPTYQTFKLKNRLIKEKVLEYKCSICKINEWNNKQISLHLDHIDGNNHNHRLENLRLLCPNCHSQTNTWCGKNK